MIRKKEKEIKELKNQRKPCEEYILKYLEEIDENIIEIGDGKLKKNKTETKIPLNKEIIKNTLHEDINDEEKIKRIIEKIENKREKNTKISLKRTIRKVY